MTRSFRLVALIGILLLVGCTLPSSGQLLNVMVDGSGTGTVTSVPSGVECSVSCSVLFPSGSTLRLTAAADVGSTFVGWKGACSTFETRCSVRMTDDRDVTATFVAVSQRQLVVEAAGSGSGRITSDLPGIDCGVDCTQVYPEGTVVTLEAVPDLSSDFIGWSGDCAGTGACQLVMGSDHIVTARFDIVTQRLSVGKAGEGVGVVTSSPNGIDCGSDCSGDFVRGSVVTLTAEAAFGSLFGGWSGACSGLDTSCTVSMTNDRSVTASFVPSPFSGDAVVEVSAGSSFTEPVLENVFLSAGEAVVYRLFVSSAVARSGDALFFDVASGVVKVTFFEVSSSGQAKARYSSTSPEWFGRAGDTGFGLVAQGIAPQPACGGPCLVVASPDQEAVRYFRVEALQNTSFDLFAVSEDFADRSETRNDSRSGATVIPRDASGAMEDSGAIEIVGDEDWFVAGENVAQVVFDSFNDHLGLVAEVFDEDGVFLESLGSGESFLLPISLPSQKLFVRVTSLLERAAAAGVATYRIEVR